MGSVLGERIQWCVDNQAAGLRELRARLASSPARIGEDLPDDEVAVERHGALGATVVLVLRLQIVADRSGDCLGVLGFGDSSGLEHPPQHLVAALHGGVGVLGRVVFDRGLHQSCEGRGLGEGQAWPRWCQAK